MAAPRVVSLLPSATEIVCALGMESSLVGRSHECDYPSTVTRLPVCTAPKFDPDGTSYQIDERVKGILGEALSVYRVDAETLRRLQPDVIVTQTQCEVCAVSADEVARAVAEWIGSPPKIVALAPNGLADVWADMQRVADALGVPERGSALIDALQERMSAVAERSDALPDRPRVVCIEWLEPLMAAGNWMPELVQQAGGINLFGLPGEHSPWLAWADVVAADPDVIIVQPCGFGIARTIGEMSLLSERPGWRDLRAVQDGRVYVVDGNQYFNRPGPRVLESLEILAETLHPETFAFRHEGSGWQRLAP